MGMRCIDCGTDNNLRDRTTHQGRCKNCNHPFAFEPSSVTDAKFKFTDPFFAKAIADISANNTLFFTPKQFLYLLDKRLRSRYHNSAFSMLFGYLLINVWSALFFGGILSIFIGNLSFKIVLVISNIFFVATFFRASISSRLSNQECRDNARNLQIAGGLIITIGIYLSIVVIKTFDLFVASVILGMLSIYLGTQQQLRLTGRAETFQVNQNQFQDWLNRWQRINAPIAKMLPSPREEIAPTAISSDISAYSFDRAVVCDSAAIAQLLIANNFHLENNCAVLSITGYPQSIFTTVMQMLSRNPDLKVYALHNASPRGVSLVHTLRSSPNWFPNSSIMIYDLGLLPRQIFAPRNVFIQASEESAQQARQLPPEVRQSLVSHELGWLETGNFVELESFSPQIIIQVLNQGIVRSQDATATDSLVLIDGGGGYMYATESFG